MTLFEYLAIAFSLLLSFTAMRLLAGLPSAAQPGRRYWVHLTFICAHLAGTVGAFWVYWSFQNANWSLLRFVLVLASPGLMYFNACSLIPENPSSVDSWRDYYYSVRRRYFIGVICWVLVAAGAGTVVLEMPLLHPARVVEIAFLLLGTLGAMSASERVHSGLAICIVAFAPVLALTLFSQPGSVAP